MISNYLYRDVFYYLKDIRSLMIFLVVYLSGLYIMVTALGQLIILEQYVEFVTIGYLTVSIMNICADSGMELTREKNSGKMQYDLTLPISSNRYALFRIIGISIRGYFNYIFCLFLSISFIIDYISVIGLITLLICGFYLALLFTCIALIPLIFSFDFTLQGIMGTSIRGLFLLCSTIFYPINYLPNWLKPIININPVTWVLAIMRRSLNLPYVDSLIVPIPILIIFLMLLILMSIISINKYRQNTF